MIRGRRSLVMLGAWIAIIIGVVTALALAFYELYSSELKKPLKVRDRRPAKVIGNARIRPKPEA
jgi:hypothetical protein